VLVAGGTEFVEWVIVLSSIAPVIGLCWFAWWFLRAGKRYDERERAADSTSRSGRPPTEKPTPR
jgi:threonine/homoserine/homoserine lactone efflux protein